MLELLLLPLCDVTKVDSAPSSCFVCQVVVEEEHPLPFCDTVKIGNVPEMHAVQKDGRVFIVETGKRDTHYVDACVVRTNPSVPETVGSQSSQGDPFWAARPELFRNFMW